MTLTSSPPHPSTAPSTSSFSPLIRLYRTQFLGAKITFKKKIFIWLKRARRKLLCDVVYFFIALVIINIAFDISLSVGSESVDTQTLTNNGKLFNEWITRK